MADANAQALKRAFNKASRDCNIIQLFRQLDITIDQTLLQRLVDEFTLDIVDVSIPIDATKTAETWTKMRDTVEETVRTEITRKLHSMSSRFQTPVEKLSDYVAKRLVEQLEEADKSRSWLSKLFTDTKEQVHASTSTRGNIGDCGEVLELTCKGVLKTDGTKVYIDVTITIKSVTLLLGATELELNLPAGSLSNGLKWHNERYLE